MALTPHLNPPRRAFSRYWERHEACTIAGRSLITIPRQEEFRKPINVKQTTLASEVETNGTGLHTAVPVQLRLLPAPPDTGYVFRRADLGGFEIPATVE